MINKQTRNLIIRLAVSVVGLVLVALTVDFRAAGNTLLNIQLSGFILALLLFQIGIGVRAVRWWMLLRPHSQNLPITNLIRLYYVGMFFNLFLPTGFGGDVVRAAELGTEIPPTTSAATVLLDRMLGLMGLFLITLIAAPFAWGTMPGEVLLPALGVSIVGMIGGVLVIQGDLFAAMLRLAQRLIGRIALFARIIQALNKFNDAIARVGRDRSAVAGAFAMSMIFNAILIWIHIVLADALMFDVPALAYTLIVPLTSILLLVPSIAGIGVREFGLVSLLGFFTQDSDTAFALSIAILLQNLFTGVFGAGVYLVYTLQKPHRTA